LVQPRKAQTPEIDTLILAETDIGEGFVVPRAFVEDDSMMPAIAAFLDEASCVPGWTGGSATGKACLNQLIQLYPLI
jgi:uncharacterized membrane protein